MTIRMVFVTHSGSVARDFDKREDAKPYEDRIQKIIDGESGDNLVLSPAFVPDPLNPGSYMPVERAIIPASALRNGEVWYYGYKL